MGKQFTQCHTCICTCSIIAGKFIPKSPTVLYIPYTFIVHYLLSQGQLVGVVGKVGCGKSSLLAAITAEMRRKDGQVRKQDV